MPRRGGGFSASLTAVAVAVIALGVVVMVMSVSILRGFRNDITDKVVGFGSHITVHPYNGEGIFLDGWSQSNGLFAQVGEESGGQNSELRNPTSELRAVAAEPVEATLHSELKKVPGIRKVQAYATKGGMVKTADQIHGIMFRGLETGFDTTFFASCLVEGRLPDFSSEVAFSAGEDACEPSEGGTPSSEVLISSDIASKLGLKVGDKMRTYFWQGESYRARAFTVCGIYRTDLTEMDELYVIGDLRQVVRLNDWPDGSVGGYELLVDDFSQLDRVSREVLERLPYNMTAVTVREANPALFSWLDLLSSNITLILTIMCIVCAVAIISALLIMIFEKSSTIGVLKTLGATNRSIGRIFILRASRLIAQGIAIGDAVALALCVVQSRWNVVKLDAESYAMSHVPVDLDWRIFLFVSLGTAVVCLLALLLPASYISKINPATTVAVSS